MQMRGEHAGESSKTSPQHGHFIMTRSTTVATRCSKASNFGTRGYDREVAVKHLVVSGFFPPGEERVESSQGAVRLHWHYYHP